MLKPTSDISHLEQELGFFSFCINRQPQNHYHCGCLYLNDDNNIFFLHLAWDYNLKNEPCPNDYYWIFLDIPQSIKKFLAGLCAAIAEAKPGVPYGLNHDGIFFNTDGSISISHNEATGLTCATFILALLKSYGLTPLNEETWPENTQQKSQNKIIVGLKKYGKKPVELIERDENLVGNRFFLPEEIVGASQVNFEKWPVDYTMANIIADQIRSEIDTMEKLKAA